MGDSETVVNQTMTDDNHISTGYTSTNYNGVTSAAGPDGGSLDSGAVGDSNFVSLSDGADDIENISTTVDGNIHNSDTDMAMQDTTVTSVANDTPTVAVSDTSGNLVSQECSVAESTQTGAYDSSVNENGDEIKISTSTGHDVNGNTSNDASQAVAEQRYDGVPVLSTEEERLWSVVKTNSSDFNSWIALIEETERVAEDNILKIRKVYDAFLAEFPLCYGYWKKYAEHVARLSSTEKVIVVFERGVEAVTYSVDMWLQYCVFAMSTYVDPEKVRRLFERGLAYVGADYLSFSLWDKYIEYEYQLQQWGRLAMIYTRILENPSQQLDRYFNSFKELAGSRPLSELCYAEAAAKNSEATNQSVDGEVNANPIQNPNLANACSTEGEELENYLAIREEMFMKTKEYDAKIIAFETAIRRPYFHVRPLNSSELENWHNYLDFIEKGDDFNKVVKLYERCLIACANYPEYWIRYVLCMEINGSMDLANNALARATQVFVKRQPEIHLFAARFKEQNGDVPGARTAYQLLHSEICPGLLEAINKHASMEHRLGNMEAAFSLYDQAIATEKGKEQSQMLPMLFAQYARFQYLVAGNVDKAREILDGALGYIQLSRPFLETLIHLESVLPSTKRIDYVDSLVEKFIMRSSDNTDSPSTTDREDLSSIFLEFLDLFGDIQMVKKATDRHSKLFLSHKRMSELKKRSAEDFMVSDKTKVAKSSAGVLSSTQPVVGAYLNTQNQWATSYAAQPQAWTQVPQVQGQQYPGYAQQDGYSGYNTSYAQPQVLVSAPQIPPSPQNAVIPQVATYGAYPPSYPTQSFTQQNHVPVQPTTAAYAPAPVQQPAPSQAYYGTYF